MEATDISRPEPGNWHSITSTIFYCSTVTHSSQTGWEEKFLMGVPSKILWICDNLITTTFFFDTQNIDFKSLLIQYRL